MDVLEVLWRIGLDFKDVWETLVFTILSIMTIKSSNSASALVFDLAEKIITFSVGTFSTGVFLAETSPP